MYIAWPEKVSLNYLTWIIIWLLDYIHLLITCFQLFRYLLFLLTLDSCFVLLLTLWFEKLHITVSIIKLLQIPYKWRCIIEVQLYSINSVCFSQNLKRRRQRQCNTDPNLCSTEETLIRGDQPMSVASHRPIKTQYDTTRNREPVTIKSCNIIDTSDLVLSHAHCPREFDQFSTNHRPPQTRNDSDRGAYQTLLNTHNKPAVHFTYSNGNSCDIIDISNCNRGWPECDMPVRQATCPSLSAVKYSRVPLPLFTSQQLLGNRCRESEYVSHCHEGELWCCITLKLTMYNIDRRFCFLGNNVYRSCIRC